MTLPDLTQSIYDWSPSQRRRAAILCGVVGLALAFLAGPHYGRLFAQADGAHYIRIAEGQPAMMPFASRQLGPLIVRAMVHVFGISIQAAYIFEGTVAMIFFFATVLFYLFRSGAPRFMLPATFGLFFWTCQYSCLVLPDLLYAALLCVFLLLLDRRRLLLAALMLLPLTVCRESTLLTLACFLIAGWRRLRLGEAALAVASTVAGSLIVRHLAANALPNNEGISPVLYLFAKLPWAFIRNFFGINPWSNVYPRCAVPRWQIALHLGPVHAVGVCGLEALPPELLVFYGLASFGLFPLLLIALFRMRKAFPPSPNQTASPDPRGQIFFRFALVYGVISFAIAGLLGETFQRLFAYGWPLFLVVLPLLLARARLTFTSNRAALTFLGLHLALSWCGVWRDAFWLIPLEIAFWIAGFFLLRNSLRSTAFHGRKTTETVL